MVKVEWDKAVAFTVQAMAEMPSETEQVTAAVNLPTKIGADLSPQLLAKLAREIAIDIRELPDILASYGLTDIQHERILANPFFAATLKAACVEWNSSLNTPERIKIEAAAILEEALPKLGARMMKDNETLPAVIEASKVFAKIAGLGERDDRNAAPGEKFTISINLGGETRVERDVTPRTITGTPSTSTSEIQIISEIPGDRSTLPAITERS